VGKYLCSLNNLLKTIVRFSETCDLTLCTLSFVLNAVGVALIYIDYTYLMFGDGFVFVGYNTLGHGKTFTKLN
jgi:maltodextrin utilization protein YvdJ